MSLEETELFDVIEHDSLESVKSNSDHTILEATNNIPTNISRNTENNYEDMAFKSLCLTLRCEFKEACQMLISYVDNHPAVCGAYAANQFLRAVFLLSDIQTEISLRNLASTSVKLKEFTNNKQKLLSYSAKIFLADCCVFYAILLFTRQNKISYVKGALRLHQAWKIYQNINDVLSATENGSSDLDTDDFKRIQGMTSFGFGLSNLVLTMLSPRIKTWLEFIGVPSGDRQLGLERLRYSLNIPNEIHSPISAIVLIVYYGYVESITYVDLKHRSRCLEEMHLYLDQSKFYFENSPLDGIFKLYSTESEDDVYAICKESKYYSTDYPELIELSFLIHKCLVDMARQNYSDARYILERVIKETSWNRSIYIYVSALCLGAEENNVKFKDVQNRLKTAQKYDLYEDDKFAESRIKFLSTIKCTKDIFKLFCIEILYHWNSLCYANKSDLNVYMQILRKLDGKVNFEALICFLQGVILKHQRSYSEAEVLLLAAKCPKYTESRLAFVQPFSCIELARCSVNRVDSDENEAKQYLMEVLETSTFKGFDFEQKANFLAHNMLNKLNVNYKL